MSYKFENLEVWKLALDYTDAIYEVVERLPKEEEFNLKSQLRRSTTSIALNIAEGSTSKTNPEQARFISISIRSLLETVACLHMTHRRNYLANREMLRKTYRSSEMLFGKLQAFRKSLSNASIRDGQEAYELDGDVPF
jgi:four helix bundle protein